MIAKAERSALENHRKLAVANDVLTKAHPLNVRIYARENSELLHYSCQQKPQIPQQGLPVKSRQPDTRDSAKDGLRPCLLEALKRPLILLAQTVLHGIEGPDVLVIPFMETPLKNHPQSN